MRIVVFDPGKTTGWCIIRADGDGTCFIIGAGGVRGFEELESCLGAIQILEEFKRIDACIYEGFARGNASTGDQLEAIELCGVIRWNAWKHDWPLVMQYPANRKGYISFAKAMLKDFAIPTNERVHAIDAVAHGLRFLARQGVYDVNA